MPNLLEKIDFGNEAGDDADLDDLANYFVKQSQFSKHVDSKQKILVATAKKGVGKSALLSWIAYSVAQTDRDALVIKVRGADLVRSKFKLTSELSTPNDHIDDWMRRICALVNRQLALKLKVALTDDKITLVETAEIEGYKSRNLVGSLLDRFERVLGDKQPKKLAIKDEIQILKRVKNRRVWILIDDLDATFQNTAKESLEIATFFSACRYLVQDVKDVVFRITMRTDVWTIIRRYDESLDKVEQYVSNILWSQRDFLRLLYLRVRTNLVRLDIAVPVDNGNTAAEEKVLHKIFAETMDWASKKQQAYKVIYTLAYERPRWGIQLCKLAQESALRHQSSTITKEHIDEVWGEYGAKRIADLVAEHKHQCPQVEELVNGFRGAERLMTRDQLFNWINNRIANHLAAHIEGQIVRSPMDIAHFLYRLGFIVARSDRDDGSYEHYTFDQMPDFLSSRTDDDFGLKWEIHPCYREALDIKKLNASHKERFGRLRQ